MEEHFLISVFHRQCRRKNDSGSPYLNGIEDSIRFRDDIFSFSICAWGKLRRRSLILVCFATCESLCDIRDDGFEFPLPL
jgi:hypothetical protein